MGSSPYVFEMVINGFGLEWGAWRYGRPGLPDVEFVRINDPGGDAGHLGASA